MGLESLSASEDVTGDLSASVCVAQEPHELVGDEVVSCYCCCPCCGCVSRGSVDAHVTINQRCFVPGETLCINGRVTNRTGSTLPNVHASIKKVCLSHCV